MGEAGGEPIDAQTRGIATHGPKDATASPGTLHQIPLYPILGFPLDTEQTRMRWVPACHPRDACLAGTADKGQAGRRAGGQGASSEPHQWMARARHGRPARRLASSMGTLRLVLPLKPLRLANPRGMTDTL